VKPGVLVTGAAGFVGRRLLTRLPSDPFDVVSYEGDVRDIANLSSVMQDRPWAHIVHLGGWSHVPSCEQNPAGAYDANLGGTALLLEAVRRHAPKARFIFASSAQVYAPLEGEGGVLDEGRPIRPGNLYARTKRAAERLLEGWSRDEGGRVAILRIFNHTHKTQPPIFFLPHIYSALMEARAKGQNEIPVGNLDVARDIGLVDDLVQAFVSIVNADAKLGNFETFNACSGKARQLSRLAEGLAHKLGIEARFVTDPARVRAGEARLLVGSSEKLRRATGWAPAERDDDAFLTAFLAD
jgi:nucleoside-diphosphate-sugar epimerase